MAVGVAAVLVACAHKPSDSSRVVDYPTLEPDDHPIDPYADRAEEERSPAPTTWEDGELQPVIPVDIELGDPRRIEAIVVRIRARTLRVPSAPNQRVEVEAGGTQRVAVKPGSGARVTRAEREAALIPTPTIDSDHALIREVAREAVRGVRDPRRRVEKLVEWIDEHISYEITDEVRASATLVKGSGDCNEQSLVFIAMARAIRLPARRVVGLVPTVTRTGSSAFGLHAWAEVALDGRWVRVDPTWNEPIADAAHITLAVGSSGDPMFGGDDVDGLSMAVVDLKRGPGGEDDPIALSRALPVHLQLRTRSAERPRASR